MKKIFLLVLLISIPIFCQCQENDNSSSKSNYIGFYGVGISTSIDRNADYLQKSEGRAFKEFSFDIYTTQGFTLYNRVILSAMFALEKQTGYHRLFLPMKGDIKYFFKPIDSEENVFFVYGNFGKSISLSPAFANGFSSAFGIGLFITGDFDEKLFVSLEIKNQQDVYNNKSYSFGSTGIKFGLSF
ncbi:hypothetical protein ACK1KB_04825 [Chryseobacterium sp. TY3]|uniref:hypothetical protein n=1 Tax=Soonwooa sp. TaxID=1938592 RepID=UPI0035B076C5